MSSRRSRFQISVEVLTAIASGEQKPTRLMYACNLSWKVISSVLSNLESKGFVDNLSVEGKRKRYCVTGKGREVLSYYNGLHALVQV